MVIRSFAADIVAFADPHSVPRGMIPRTIAMAVPVPWSGAVWKGRVSSEPTLFGPSREDEYSCVEGPHLPTDRRVLDHVGRRQ